MYASTTLQARKSRTSCNQFGISPAVVALVMVGIVIAGLMSSATVVGMADEKFTDIFYTNSFRGAFNWIKKLDWVGMIVQCVISCFSLFGVALMTIRIMTSMLYLSSKGLWEEVHDQKDTGGSEIYDFGLLNMAKNWAKGKAGTGLDAVIGAVLILLPDVKRYSDFGEKAGGKFEEDMSISQYMLKIALPTIMTVFFFAMGFNGTLFQFLAITVDAMGTAADKAISVNYAGIIEDLVNSGTGYKFVFNANGTNLGQLQQKIAKDMYGRAVAELNSADADQLYEVGKNIETIVKQITPASIGSTPNIAISTTVKNGLVHGAGSGGDGGTPPPSGVSVASADQYIPYLGYEIIVNGSNSATGEYKCYRINSTSTEGGDRPLLAGVSRVEQASTQAHYLHLFITQTTSFNGTYFNLDGASANH